jgi:hypothetical protein
VLTIIDEERGRRPRDRHKGDDQDSMEGGGAGARAGAMAPGAPARASLARAGCIVVGGGFVKGECTISI